MAQPCGEARLPHRASQQDLALLPDQVIGDRDLLDRDLTIEELVMGAPHRRHVAPAQPSHQAVPSGQQPPFVPQRRHGPGLPDDQSRMPAHGRQGPEAPPGCCHVCPDRSRKKYQATVGKRTQRNARPRVMVREVRERAPHDRGGIHEPALQFRLAPCSCRALVFLHSPALVFLHSPHCLNKSRGVASRLSVKTLRGRDEGLQGMDQLVCVRGGKWGEKPMFHLLAGLLGLAQAILAH